jgi:hypothetical protein
VGELKMGPTDCPKTLVTNYHYKLYNIPKWLRSQYQLQLQGPLEMTRSLQTVHY